MECGNEDGKYFDKDKQINRIGDLLLKAFIINVELHSAKVKKAIDIIDDFYHIEGKIYLEFDFPSTFIIENSNTSEIIEIHNAELLELKNGRFKFLLNNSKNGKMTYERHKKGFFKKLLSKLIHGGNYE